MLVIAKEYIATTLALRQDRRAVTAIEYALIASLIAIVIIAGATAIGVRLSTIFGNVSSGL